MDSIDNRFEISFIEKTFPNQKVYLNKGDLLFKEGESNDFVFFIESGSIKVLKNKWVIGITQPLEFVGITSCLNEGNHYNFSAKAIVSSVVLKIGKIDFKIHLLSNPIFCKKIIQILCERIKLTDNKTRSLVEHKSQFRLIHELVSSTSSVPSALQTFLNAEDLAELTGISLRNVKKMIKELSQQNLITQNNHKEIILIDRLKLQQILQK